MTHKIDTTIAPIIKGAFPEFISFSSIPGKGYGVFARAPINKGDTIFKFQGSVTKKAAVRNFNAALQIDSDLFLESEGTFDELANHSCDPNCAIDFNEWSLVAKRNIQKGEELVFNYNVSEYDLVDQGCSFQCRCGAKNCVGTVNGFKYLSLQGKEELMPTLSPYLREKLDQEILHGTKARKKG